MNAEAMPARVPGTPISADAAWRRLRATASAPYRRAGRFAYHFARGKLGGDPVFRGLLERGDLRAGSRVLDIGCGQGLLASLLAAVDGAAAHGEWPGAWPAAPAACRYAGIELQPKDVERARAALVSLPHPAAIICGDMCGVELPASDVVVILDVLHYVPHASQEAVLHRVRDALSPRGRLLLRVGDAASHREFAVSQWVDRCVTRIRGHRVAPTFGRSIADWTSALRSLGFTVRAVPMSRGTPFANVLLVADRARPESNAA